MTKKNSTAARELIAARLGGVSALSEKVHATWATSLVSDLQNTALPCATIEPSRLPTVQGQGASKNSYTMAVIVLVRNGSNSTETLEQLAENCIAVVSQPYTQKERGALRLIEPRPALGDIEFSPVDGIPSVSFFRFTVTVAYGQTTTQE